MKTALQALRIGLCALALGATVTAQGAQFFRIAGPVPTAITAAGADGYVTWTNVATNATFTVQTTASVLSESNWVDYVRVPATNGVTISRLYDPNPPSGMALIPAGSFTMGDTVDGEIDAIPTNVTVSAFYMDTNLVSYVLWTNVYQWAMNNGYDFANAGKGKAANHPVRLVSWFDCVEWCNARSQQAGLTPVYCTDAGFTQVFTNGAYVEYTTVYANWGANGYRLPTEAEWEKAARGGLSGQRFPWGNTISWSQANYSGYPGSLGGYAYDLATAIDYNPAFSGGDNGDYPYTSPVGTFPANGYGLNDMAGNVSEWCWDCYASSYAGGTDPRGPVGGPFSFHVLRGGNWINRANEARCAYRYYFQTVESFHFIGFRCVRGL